jgi:hypothetical protein
MDVGIDGSQGAHEQPPERYPRSGEHLSLETPMASKPTQGRPIGPSLKRSGHGESRVYMSPRTPAHYQKTH